MAFDILICIKAVERSKKDSFVRNNLGKYIDEIIKIATGHRDAKSAERAGEFLISPKHYGDIRVVWYMREYQGKKYLCICDFLYHTTKNKYVDQWDTLVRTNKVHRAFYEQAQFYACSAASAETIARTILVNQ